MSTAELRCEGYKSEELEKATTWDKFERKIYQCRVLLCPEVGGGFSAHALTLPGAVSEGETDAEALANIREALQGLIAEYTNLGRSIPWGEVEVEHVPKGAKERWIVVNA